MLMLFAETVATSGPAKWCEFGCYEIHGRWRSVHVADPLHGDSWSRGRDRTVPESSSHRHRWPGSSQESASDCSTKIVLRRPSRCAWNRVDPSGNSRGWVASLRSASPAQLRPGTHGRASGQGDGGLSTPYYRCPGSSTCLCCPRSPTSPRWLGSVGTVVGMVLLFAEGLVLNYGKEDIILSAAKGASWSN